MWLHARHDAVGFYERMGYVPEGSVFVSELTGIPHRTMRRAIG
jgi:predicted GNAT family N-acyltransferase